MTDHVRHTSSFCSLVARALRVDQMPMRMSSLLRSTCLPDISVLDGVPRAIAMAEELVYRTCHSTGPLSDCDSYSSRLDDLVDEWTDPAKYLSHGPGHRTRAGHGYRLLACLVDSCCGSYEHMGRPEIKIQKEKGKGKGLKPGINGPRLKLHEPFQIHGRGPRSKVTDALPQGRVCRLAHATVP